MAWWTIDHTCGHTSEQQIYGTDVRGEREYTAKQRGKQPCPDCLQRDRDERSRAAAERAESEGWPELTGSRKQIAWAQTLRAEAVDAVTAQVRRAYAASEAMVRLATMLLLRERTTAAWWIDQRSRIDWFDTLRQKTAWSAAEAQIRPGATLEEIELDFENVEEPSDLERAMGRAEAALKVGQISPEQFVDLESDFVRIALRLDCEWGS